MSKNRLSAIKEAENEQYEIAILDDGLQDKSINNDINLVCFNTINWIGNGMAIPAGPLRENIKNLKNYKHIFLNGNLENIENLKKQIFKINPEVNIFLGRYEPININEFEKNGKYLVFSGIGNHKTFISMLKNYGLNILKEIEFPDHYQFKKSDIDFIIREARNMDCKIVTTEKDYLRIDSKESNEFKFIKSELQIINEEEFIKFLV